MTGKQTLSCIILTHNEAIHIERAIGCLASLANRVFVVDSFSTDGTVEIARSRGATVVQHAFVNYAQQFQWALDNLPIETDWVMRLDADEILTPELVREIEQHLPGLPPEVTGVVLKLGYVFLGRRIRYGGRYLNLLRIIRRGAARIERRWMDEHLVLLHGQAVTFRNRMLDCSLKDLTFFIDKHNKYATREALDVLIKKHRLFEIERRVLTDGTSLRMASRRWIKEKIYNRLPFGLGPLCYFLYRYFLLLGFLDGREGLIYHFLQGFWYRFLVEAKVFELRRAVSHLHSPAEIKSELSRLTGLPIE